MRTGPSEHASGFEMGRAGQWVACSGCAGRSGKRSAAILDDSGLWIFGAECSLLLKLLSVGMIFIFFKIKQREDFDQCLSPIFLRWKTQILALHFCTELCFDLRQIMWQNAWICETSGIASYVFLPGKKRRKIMLHETSFYVGVFLWCSKLKLTLYSEYVICAA